MITTEPIPTRDLRAIVAASDAGQTPEQIAVVLIDQGTRLPRQQAADHRHLRHPHGFALTNCDPGRPARWTGDAVRELLAALDGVDLGRTDTVELQL